MERNLVAIYEKPLDNDEESVYVVCMKRVNFHLTSGQVKSLKARSDETGLSVAELIRRAIDYWLEHTEDKHDGKQECEGKQDGRQDGKQDGKQVGE